MGTKFSMPVTVQQVAMRVDRSVAIQVRTTQEIPEHEFAEAHKAFGKIGWFVFSENEIEEIDVPKEEAPGDAKSPTQRLYAALFVLHGKESPDEDFESYRRRKMGQLIEFVKNKIAEYD